MLEQEPSCKKQLLSGRTAAENYREASLLWVFMDAWVETHHPEHFEALCAEYDTRLVNTTAQLAVLAQEA